MTQKRRRASNMSKQELQETLAAYPPDTQEFLLRHLRTIDKDIVQAIRALNDTAAHAQTAAQQLFATNGFGDVIDAEFRAMWRLCDESLGKTHSMQHRTRRLREALEANGDTPRTSDD